MTPRVLKQVLTPQNHCRSVLDKHSIITLHTSKLAGTSNQRRAFTQDLARTDLAGASAPQVARTQDLTGACTRV